jgi:hypothetical protein
VRHIFMTTLRQRVALPVAVSVLAFLALSGQASPAAAAAKPGSSAHAAAAVRSSRPAHAEVSGMASVDSSGSSAGQSAAVGSAVAAARAQALRTDRPVTVSALTTATTTVTVRPKVEPLTVREYMLPVRVLQQGKWVPVSTSLHRSGRALVPAAVPGDSIRVSGGLGSALASVSVAHTSIGLSWPGRLPRPVVAGSSATYLNVLPGVNLVVTVSSAAAGVVSEVFVVKNPGAAEALEKSGLDLGVSTSAVRLMSAAGGGAIGAVTQGPGDYLASPGAMWDSSHVAITVSRARRAAAEAAARRVGAQLAQPAGTSSAAGPGGGALLAGVGMAVTRGGRGIALRPDLPMLSSRTTVYPVYIAATSLTWQAPSDSIVTGTAVSKATSRPARGGVSPLTALSSCPLPSGETCQWEQAPNGADQHYAEMQSACPKNTPNPSYDVAESKYDYAYYSMGTGYDGFGDCTVDGMTYNGYVYSYFTLTVPSVLNGAKLYSATINTPVAFAGECGSDPYVTLSKTSSFSKNTDWDTMPSASATSNAVTRKVPAPGTGNCGTEFDTNPSSWPSVSFDIGSLLDTSDSAFTYRLWEDGDCPSSCSLDGNDDDWLRFGDSPYLQAQYDTPPTAPSNLKATSGSTGSGSVGCATSESKAEKVSPTSGGGPYLWATYNDANSDGELTFTYWNASVSGSAHETLTWPSNAKLGSGSTTLMSSGASGNPEIPESWMKDGGTSGGAVSDSQFLEWEVQATDMNGFTSGTTSPCYAEFEPTAQPAPTLTPDFTVEPTVGTTVQFTITANNSSADPATGFVWSLDQTLPASPAADQKCPYSGTCTFTAASGSSNATATLTLVVPDPGYQYLWVAAVDSGGIESTATDGANGSPGTFTASTDPNITCPSFTDALTNDCSASEPSMDNQMISSEDGESGTANGDGTGSSFDEQLLKNDGWEPNEQVTVDGASFTLPDFDNSDTPDNLLAANQTIDMAGEGSSLVFLATGTNSNATTVSPSQDPANTAAPFVDPGWPTTGTGCGIGAAFDINDSGCAPATGQITYASGGNCPSLPVPYSLTVPDWVEGEPYDAVVSFPDRDTSSGDQAESFVMMYAFAVPLIANCQVQSVTLPDVGDTTTATVASGVSENLPALHVFGMSFRNTTTTTPDVDGTQEPAPAGQAWTAAYESPMAVSSGTAYTFGDTTLRIPAAVSVSAAANSTYVRVRLSMPWFATTAGTEAVNVGAATVSLQSAAGSVVPASGTMETLTFGGSASTTVPIGGDVYSDPLKLPYSVNAGQDLMVSVYISSASVVSLPTNLSPAGIDYEWFASGNSAASTSASPFSSEQYFENLLTGIDFTTTPATGSASPGEPTVVVAGDNVLDLGSGEAFIDSDSSGLSQRLAGQFAGLPASAGYGVVSAGLADNYVTVQWPASDDVPNAGVTLVSRIDRDVLAEPDVGTVVIDEGLADLTSSGSYAPTPATLEANGLGPLVIQLGEFGINVIVATLTPCDGYNPGEDGIADCNTTSTDPPDACASSNWNNFPTTPASVDLSRDVVNEDICSTSGMGTSSYCAADTDGAVSTTSSPGTLAAADNSGDDMNLSAAGYLAMANALTNATPGDCYLTGNQTPAPPVGSG